MINHKKKGGFTLVELIIVMTVLAILGIISFVSYSGYSVSARDTVRKVDVKNIQKALIIKRAINGGNYPLPENYIEIADGSGTISYQGVIGDKLLGMLRISNGGKDPLDKSSYIYTVNAEKNKFQLGAYMETIDGQQQFSFLGEPAYADDYTKRYFVSSGDEVGILLDPTTNSPLLPGVTFSGVSFTGSVNITSSSSGIVFKAVLNNQQSGNTQTNGSILSSVLRNKIVTVRSTYLSNLVATCTDSTAVLNPGFNTEGSSYDYEVASGVTSVKLTPTFPAGGVATVNGLSLLAGSRTITLTALPMAIPVVVSKGSDTQTYTINVRRKNNSYLSNLVLSDGTLSPTFSKTNLSYTANVGYDVSSITLTPTAEDSGASIIVNGSGVLSGTASNAIPLTAGETTSISIIISTQEGSSQTYTLNVTRASSPYLLSIIMSGIRLPPFVKTTYSYPKDVATTIASTIVTATAESDSATIAITLNNTPYTNGASIPLAVGLNSITVKVTSATGGDIKTYIYDITRQVN